MNDGCFGPVLFIIFVCGAFIFYYTTDTIECSAKANALGYKHEYHIFTGCVLEKPDGKKVLLQQLRDFANE